MQLIEAVCAVERSPACDSPPLTDRFPRGSDQCLQPPAQARRACAPALAERVGSHPESDAPRVHRREIPQAGRTPARGPSRHRDHHGYHRRLPRRDRGRLPADRQLAETVGFDHGFIFRYSPRRDTPAATMGDQLSEEVKEARNQDLLSVIAKSSREKLEAHVGQRVEILCEGPSKTNAERLTGRTRTNKVVVFEGAPRHIGQSSTCRSSPPRHPPCMAIPPCCKVRAREFDLKRTLESGQVFHAMRSARAGRCWQTGRHFTSSRTASGFSLRKAGGLGGSVFLLRSSAGGHLRGVSQGSLQHGGAALVPRTAHHPPATLECVGTFITSPMKQVSHIRQISLTLRERYGKKVPGSLINAYPTPDALAALKEEDLRDCKLGFRARGLLGTARTVAAGSVDLDAISSLPTAEARKALCTLPGVGRKVANCILLFAYERLDAVRWTSGSGASSSPCASARGPTSPWRNIPPGNSASTRDMCSNIFSTTPESPRLCPQHEVVVRRRYAGKAQDRDRTRDLHPPAPAADPPRSGGNHVPPCSRSRRPVRGVDHRRTATTDASTAGHKTHLCRQYGFPTCGNSAQKLAL